MREWTFELTEDLIKLLRASNVADDFSPYEWGALWVDPKRPYGNGDIVKDICRILGLPVDEDGDPSEEHRTLCFALHAKTPTALQVVLATGAFAPGTYRRSGLYESEWGLVEGSTET